MTEQPTTKSLMRVVHLEMHEVSGVSGLANEDDTELLSWENGNIRVFLTMDRDLYYLHIRRLAALGTVTAESMAGTGGNRLAPYQQRFRDTFARTHIKHDGISRGAFMITKVEDEIDIADLEHLQDFGDFGVRIQIFDNSPLREAALRATRAAHACLTLALSENVTDTLRSFGTVDYAIDPDTKRLLYSLNVNASMSMTSLTNMTHEMTSEAARFADAIRQNDGVANIVRLLSLSGRTDTDHLTAFLAAWSGLELFVQAVFKSHYEPHVFEGFQTTAPTGSFVERVREVMKGKYNIRDKFDLVSSSLGGVDAEADIEIFKQIKKRRDDLAHAMSGDLGQLPTAETRRLLRKYLKLHLTGC